jgi:hypothetical protein
MTGTNQIDKKRNQKVPFYINQYFLFLQNI